MIQEQPGVALSTETIIGIAGLVVGVLGLIPLVLYVMERRGKARETQLRRRAEAELVKQVQRERERLTEGKSGRYRGLNTTLPTDLTPSLGMEWAESRAQARITTLVSGKGGVGKSVLALALTEHYSMEDKVLLVDFDMHHRGLTSLLLPSVQPDFEVDCDVFGELKRFRGECLTAAKETALGRSGRYDLNKLTPKEFEEICERFVYSRTADGAKAVRALGAVRLPDNPVLNASNAKTIGACQCFLLPNVRHEEGFLLTDVSRMDISEVFLFLRCLAEWAHTSLGVTRMVIDSGGAHDAFAVGAVLAASHLTVVTTSEPGAIEGTAEIVVFSRRLVDDKVFMPESDALVLNQYRIQSEQCIAELCELFQGLVKKHVDGGAQLTPVRVRNSESVRALMQNYAFPSLHSCEDLWTLVGAMSDTRAAGPRTRSEARTSVGEGASPVLQTELAETNAGEGADADHGADGGGAQREVVITPPEQHKKKRSAFSNWISGAETDGK